MKSDIIFYKILCWLTPQRSDQSYRKLDILKAERNRMSRGGLNFLCGILSSYHPACMISDETSKGIHVNQTTLTFPFPNSHHGVAPGFRTLLVYSVICNQWVISFSEPIGLFWYMDFCIDSVVFYFTVQYRSLSITLLQSNSISID